MEKLSYSPDGTVNLLMTLITISIALKVENLISNDPALPLLDSIYPGETFVHTPVGICRSFFTTLFIIEKNWKHYQRIKLWYIQTVDYYTIVKKDELQLLTNIDENLKNAA